MGEYESLNFSIGILPVDIALFHALYRTSIKGRKDLINLIFSDDDSEASIDQLDDTYTSRVVEMFNVILKSLGIELSFENEDEKFKVLDDTVVKPHNIWGKIYMCTDFQAETIERIYEIRDKILEENPIIVNSKLRELTEELLKVDDNLNGASYDNIDNRMIDVIFDEEMKKIDPNNPDTTPINLEKAKKKFKLIKKKKSTRK